MDGPEQTTGRRHIRVKLRVADADELVRFRTHLAPNGLFIKTSKMFDGGQSVAVEVCYSGGGRALRGVGTVSYVGIPNAEGLRGISFDLEWDDASFSLVKLVLGRPSVSPHGDESGKPSMIPPAVESIAPPPIDDDEVTDQIDHPKARRSVDLIPFDEPSETVPESSPETKSDPSAQDGEAEEPARAASEDDEDLTVESAAPDFEQLAAQVGTAAGEGEAPAEPTVDEVGEGSLVDEGEEAPRTKSGVWTWFKKRFGSGTATPPEASEEDAPSEEGSTDPTEPPK